MMYIRIFYVLETIKLIFLLSFFSLSLSFYNNIEKTVYFKNKKEESEREREDAKKDNLR
jgi:hypothetical protein